MEVRDVADFVEVKHALVDGVTIVFELDVNSVAGKDAHAVNLVSEYGFGELGETAVFVEHVGRRVEATIMREDRFRLCLHYFVVQSEGIGLLKLMEEVLRVPNTCMEEV